MTPDAVAASFKALLPRGSLIKNANVENVSAGDGTVTFTLEQPFASLLAYLLDPAVPVLAASSFGPGGVVTSIIATGPYRDLGTAADCVTPRRLAARVKLRSEAMSAKMARSAS